MTPQAETPVNEDFGAINDVSHSVHQGPDDEKAVITALPQFGVQRIEAVTVAWTSTALIFAYVMIWLTYFVEGMLSGSTAALAPYVTSTFAQHSLTPTVGILSSVIGDVTPISRLPGLLLRT